MSAQVGIRKISEGPNNLVIRVDMVCTGGEMTKQVIFSPSDLDPARPDTETAFRVMQAWWGTPGFTLFLGYNTLSDTPVWTFSGDNHIDFRSFGGLMDYASIPPGDVDGKLWISTQGFVEIGTTGNLILDLKKTNTAVAGIV